MACYPCAATAIEVLGKVIGFVYISESMNYLQALVQDWLSGTSKKFPVRYSALSPLITERHHCCLFGMGPQPVKAAWDLKWRGVGS